MNSSDFILKVSTDGTGLLDLGKMDLCFKFGYKTAIENMDKIKEAIL